MTSKPNNNASAAAAGAAAANDVEESKSDGGMEFDGGADGNVDNPNNEDDMFNTAIGPNGAAQPDYRETSCDAVSMRTQSVASVDIASVDVEAYNQEKARMHDELMALKEAADRNDPNFQKKLDALIEKTAAVSNIEKTNQAQSFIEEGETHIKAREEYKERVRQIELQENQLILDNNSNANKVEEPNSATTTSSLDDSDEFQDAIESEELSSDEETEEAKQLRIEIH